MEFCPVCMLRKSLAGGVASGGSSFEEAVKPTPEHVAQRFEHYELATGEDGKLVELGRGATGITYKALDINLRCPVTLKVISERHLGDESARLRFLREARAAAGVRHPNTARVSTSAEPVGTALGMVTGHSVFRGSPAEVMYQHQRALFRSNCSKLFHSRSLFSLRCFLRRIRRSVFRIRPNC
jgi:hypothetical protein